MRKLRDNFAFPQGDIESQIERVEHGPILNYASVVIPTSGNMVLVVNDADATHPLTSKRWSKRTLLRLMAGKGKRSFVPELSYGNDALPRPARVKLRTKLTTSDVFSLMAGLLYPTSGHLTMPQHRRCVLLDRKPVILDGDILYNLRFGILPENQKRIPDEMCWAVRSPLHCALYCHAKTGSGHTHTRKPEQREACFSCSFSFSTRWRKRSGCRLSSLGRRIVWPVLGWRSSLHVTQSRSRWRECS
jgi:hypothetical protein